MIKKLAKTTSLLVAGASLMSLVPVVANAATTTTNTTSKIESQDGTITKAIAFADGKYMYEGYKGDADSALYYSKGSGTDKTLKDIEDGELVSKFGKSSVIVEDGSDNYVVDLSNANINEEDASDLNDDAERKIERTLNKVDRYDGYTIGTVTTGSAVQLDLVTPNQFNDKVWYEYKADKSGAASLFGFTDADGNYIDASYTANIYIFNGDSTRKIKNFDDEDNGIKVSLKALNPIAQDSSYIYAIATVQVVGGKDLTGAAITGDQYYLQKISKAKGETEDEATLPNSVTSYLISNKANDEDMDTAYSELLSVAANGVVSLKENVGVRVDGDKLFFTTVDSDEVKVTTFELKNAKLEPTTGSKVTVYGVFYKDDAKQDVENADSVSIDIDGNVWALNKGKIYESVKGGDFEKIYTSDGSFDSIDVYDKNNIVVWDSNGDSYGALSGHSATDTSTTGTTDANAVTSTVKVGWNKTTAGVWNYSKDGQTIVSNAWIQDKGTWYYLGANGTMQTGWLQNGGAWYYLDQSGAMKTGWQQVGGVWYYLNGSGAMQTGWFNDGGTWYYLNANGSMAANTVVDGYQLGANGAWVR